MKRLALLAMAIGSATLAASYGASGECLEYVKCSEATGTVKGSLDSRFGQGGSCWVGGKDHDVCTEQCRVELDLLAVTRPDAGCRTFRPRIGVGCGF